MCNEEEIKKNLKSFHLPPVVSPPSEQLFGVCDFSFMRQRMVTLENRGKSSNQLQDTGGINMEGVRMRQSCTANTWAWQKKQFPSKHLYNISDPIEAGLEIHRLVPSQGHCNEQKMMLSAISVWQKAHGANNCTTYGWIPIYTIYGEFTHFTRNTADTDALKSSTFTGLFPSGLFIYLKLCCKNVCKETMLSSILRILE